MINKSHPNQCCKFLECFSCFYLSPNCWEKHQLHKLNWLQSVTVFIPQSIQNVRIISAVSFYCLQWHSGENKVQFYHCFLVEMQLLTARDHLPAAAAAARHYHLWARHFLWRWGSVKYLCTAHKHTYAEITFTTSASSPPRQSNRCGHVSVQFTPPAKA